MTNTQEKSKQKSIGCSIDYELFERWKKSGVKVNHVFALGMQAVERNPGYIERILTLETHVDKLNKRLLSLELRTEIENRISPEAKP